MAIKKKQKSSVKKPGVKKSASSSVGAKKPKKISKPAQSSKSVAKPSSKPVAKPSSKPAQSSKSGQKQKLDKSLDKNPDKSSDKRSEDIQKSVSQTPKEAKKQLALQTAEKRKIMELKKELDNLNKEKAEVFTDVEGRRYCNEENCDQLAVTDIYCRYHYLALWKYLRKKKKLLKDSYLSNTIQELIQSFGEPALHCILKDLKSEKSFDWATKEIIFSVEKEEEAFNSETENF